MIEIEYKFRVKNLNSLFEKLEGLKPKVMYISDTIWGSSKNKNKIRERKVYNGETLTTSYEQTTPIRLV